MAAIKANKEATSANNMAINKILSDTGQAALSTQKKAVKRSCLNGKMLLNDEDLAFIQQQSLASPSQLPRSDNPMRTIFLSDLVADKLDPLLNNGRLTLLER